MTDEAQQPDTQTDTRKTPVQVTRRQRTVGLCCSFLAFVVVYVAMAGPVAFLHNSINIRPFRSAIETIYAPVVFIVDNNVPPFSGMIKAWIELFT